MPAGRLLFAVLLTLLSLSVRGDATADDTDRPTMTVKSTEDFEVDGKGSAPAWEKATWAILKKRPSGTLPYETRVKMLHSKKGVYVLLDGTDAKLSAAMTKDNDQLWTEDVYEAFFWTDESSPIYFEYEISPLNKELPILVPNYDGKFKGWLPWMYTGGKATRKAVAIIDGEQKTGAAIKGWRAEIFIPYVLLEPLQNVPPKPGSKWRANFYRMDYDDGDKTQWDWARVGNSFHEYKKFGTLVFE